MKPHIQKIIGKSIEKVIVTEAFRNPKHQVYLLFTDGTHFELYGDWFTCANHIEHGDEGAVLSFLQSYERTKVTVYSDRGENPDG